MTTTGCNLQVLTVQLVGAEDHSLDFPLREADQIYSVLLAVQGTERSGAETNQNLTHIHTIAVY